MQKIDKIYCFINDPKSVYIIGKALKDSILNSMDIITRDDKDKYPTELLNSLKGLITTTVQSEITDKFKVFLNSYAKIILEWNDKDFNDENIKNMCEHLIRFSNDDLNLNEFLNYYNEVNLFLMSSSNIESSLFKLSDHYFNILCEE